MKKKRPKKIKKIAWSTKLGAMAYTKMGMKLQSRLFPLDRAALQSTGRWTQPSEGPVFIFPDENMDFCSDTTWNRSDGLAWKVLKHHNLPYLQTFLRLLWKSKKSVTFLLSRSVIFTRGHFSPQGTSGTVWRNCWLSQLWE